MSVINTTAAAVASGSMEVELLANVGAIIMSARSEILLFVSAMVAYFVLFMQRAPTNSKLKNKKPTVLKDDYQEDDYPNDTITKGKVMGPKDCAQAEKSFQHAFNNGDYRSALRCWNTMKSFESPPSVSLPHVVESMQRFKKDTPFILRELQGFFTNFPSECGMSRVNELLDSVAKRLDSDLVEKIVDMLPALDLKMNERSYEVILNMYFTTRSFQDVETIVSQMKANKIPFTARSSMLVIKSALKSRSFDDAVQHFRELKSTWTSSSPSSTPSMSLSHVVSQLVELACKEHKLSEFIFELSGTPVSDEVVNTMLLECVWQKNPVLTSSVEKLARDQGVSFTPVSYSLLIKGMSGDRTRVQSLFEEVINKGIDVSADLVGSVLTFCAQTSNVDMAEKLYVYMKPQQLPALSAFVRFYSEMEQYEKACDVYEQDLLRLHGVAEGTNEPSHRSLHLDTRVERSLMTAAVKCGRTHLAKDLLNSSPSEVANHITMIRSCAKEGNLQAAMSVFSSLEQSGVELNSVMYNTILDACVECRDLRAAEDWMERMKKDGMIDVVSFNTLIKVHLQKGSFEKARCLMAEMRKEGLQPNRVTFNELINAMVVKGGNVCHKQMWDIVEEMKVADVKPNQVTISILLKSLSSYSPEVAISKTMELINTMEEPMDEVLLSSLVEACVRIGKPDLLASQLKHLQDSCPVAITGSHTYGSLIKAYGYARDVHGIWRCWKEMRSHHIKPTSITLGCMIEAIVSNGDTEGAFDLIHQMQDDEHCQGAINSVIYCSVLKGFTRERKIDRVWAVYEEMKDRKVELSVVTYNTIIDACARGGRMEYLPKILEEMKTYHANPNVITYSTMLKGHCHNGNMTAAFAILEQMRKEKDMRLKPDEIMYNSLIDGCAQNGLVDEGLRLLEEMQSEGVKPSNFTLSILVKLMHRSHRLDQAFALVDQITKQYHFRPNAHVYTNLIQACVSNQQLPKGMQVLEQMVQERIAPDSRTYGILVRANIYKGFLEQAAGLVRGALGLSDALPFLRHASCAHLDHAVVTEALVGLAERGRAKDLAVPLLSDIRQNASWVHIDAATQRKVMSPCISSDGGGNRQGKGKGKGKASR